MLRCILSLTATEYTVSNKNTHKINALKLLNFCYDEPQSYPSSGLDKSKTTF